MVRRADGEPDLLYIDLHLVHEVTSPQAFEGLRLTGRPVRRPELTIATQDHNVPTDTRVEPFADPLSQQQVESLRENCEEFGVPLYDTLDPRQGIVHIIGPEQGLTQPGLTIVCGDSHTSTHGALGALAFGIGTSEVEHVLATQTLPQAPLKQMSVEVTGKLPAGLLGQGRDPDDSQHDRHRRRSRPRDRIPRRRDSRPLDGGPNDGLQHDHRGRCAGWSGCAGRDDV